VYIGAPIARQPGEDHMALIERVRVEIQAALDRWRAEEARAA